MAGMETPDPRPTDRTFAAAGLMAGYAVIIGVTDNYVRVIASEAGLWQFHATRSVIAVVLLIAAAGVMGLRLRPIRMGAVVARSLLHGSAMLVYFGALAFLPVALVAAGLFTAPIFVLLISGLVYRQPIGAAQMFAVALGFGGVVLVLGSEAVSGASLAAVLPVLAGAMYALGNIATRQWCAQESAATLVAGFFVALGVMGTIGMAVLTVMPLPVSDGAAGFLQRGPVMPGAAVWGLMALQAVGSVVGVGMMVRAYQLVAAARASVFEYLILPASALWGWVIWGEVLSHWALIGMALIAAAGVLISLRR